MLYDTTLKVGERSPAVYAVVVRDVGNSFLGPKPSDLRCNRQASCAVAFANLQQIARYALLVASGTFFIPLAVSVVPNPPYPATLSELTHHYLREATDFVARKRGSAVFEASHPFSLAMRGLPSRAAQSSEYLARSLSLEELS